MNLMFDVVAIGSATRDNFLEGDFKIVPYPKTDSGKALILPFGEKIGAKRAYFTIGGNSANASVTFARQGFKTAIAALVGKDVSGEELKRRLHEEGINTSFIKQSSAPTAYSVLLLEGGERTIISCPGASRDFSLDDVELHKLSAKWWYVSLPGDSYRSLGKLISASKKMGVKVALNPTMRHITKGRKELLASLKHLSFLVMNESEAAALTGVSFAKKGEVFRKLDNMMPGIMAITDGPKGVTVSDNKFIYRAGIFKERKLVDRTGAGDAFGSGFVAGLMRRNSGIYSPEDIEYAIRLASANSTAKVEMIGATEGLLTRRKFESNPRFKKLKIDRKRI